MNTTPSHDDSCVADARDTGNSDILDLAETTFARLIGAPVPLTLDGAALGHGMPARPIGLDELRAILLHPSTELAACDAAWAELVRRSRTPGIAWMVACVGVALPGLKGISQRQRRKPHGSRVPCMSAEVLAAFYMGLRAIDLDKPKIAVRLLWRTEKTVERALHPRTHLVPVGPSALTTLAERSTTHMPSADSADELLQTAVRREIITPFEADLIAMTRLENRSLAALAEELGTAYEALAKRRRRAELRLVEAMRDDGLRDDLSDLMSRPGL